jgi:hypothetical protein
MENERGEERKINGEAATPILIAGGATSPSTIAQDIHVVWVISKPISDNVGCIFLQEKQQHLGMTTSTAA